jgi:hypothetical protein
MAAGDCPTNPKGAVLDLVIRRWSVAVLGVLAVAPPAP